MPRTKAQKQQNKRIRNSDGDNLKIQLKELQRIHDEFESEESMVWQHRKEEVRDFFQQFRSRFTRTVLDMTIADLVNRKTPSSDSLLTEASGSLGSKYDDGTYSYISTYCGNFNKRCFLTNFTYLCISFLWLHFTLTFHSIKIISRCYCSSVSLFIHIWLLVSFIKCCYGLK